MADRFRLVLDTVSYEIERRDNLLLVDGQEFSFAIKDNTVIVQGNAHKVELSGGTATVDGITHPFEVIGLAEQKPSGTRKGVAISTRAEEDAITAIMPGVVVRVLKKEGDRVEAGEVVLILEAMKMQNELRANKSGVIKQINAREREPVGMGQVLVIIE